MASQGQLQAQRASASIGMQESKIGMQRAREAGRLQTLERSGAQYAEQMRLRGAEEARGLEWSKTGTLLGMAQQRTAAANQARAEAKAAQMSAIGDIGEVGLKMMAGGGENTETDANSAKMRRMNTMEEVPSGPSVGTNLDMKPIKATPPPGLFKD
jgi:hypothetical protein